MNSLEGFEDKLEELKLYTKSEYYAKDTENLQDLIQQEIKSLESVITKLRYEQ